MINSFMIGDIELCNEAIATATFEMYLEIKSMPEDIAKKIACSVASAKDEMVDDLFFWGQGKEWSYEDAVISKNQLLVDAIEGEPIEYMIVTHFHDAKDKTLEGHAFTKINAIEPSQLHANVTAELE